MHRSRPAVVAGALAAVLAVAGLSACGGSGPVAAPTASAITSAATASGGSSDGVSASATTTVTVSPTVTAAPTLSATPTRPLGTPSARADCLSGTVEITYPGSDNPLRSVCVHAGTRIRITLRAQPGAPWRAVVTSAPQTVALLGDSVSAGSVDATAQAVGAGVAVLSAETRQPMGAQQQLTKRWQLEVTVVP